MLFEEQHAKLKAGAEGSCEGIDPEDKNRVPGRQGVLIMPPSARWNLAAGYAKLPPL